MITVSEELAASLATRPVLDHRSNRHDVWTDTLRVRTYDHTPIRVWLAADDTPCVEVEVFIGNRWVGTADEAEERVWLHEALHAVQAGHVDEVTQ